MSRRASPVTVHVRRSPLQEALAGLDDLWSRSLAEGSRIATSEHVVIRLATASADPLVEQTARSLSSYVERAGIWKTVTVRDPRFDVEDLPTEQTRLRSCCFRDGVPLRPSAFGDFDLILVCRPQRHSVLLHSSLLAAQTAALHLAPIGRRALAREAVFEAHRLARADLGVVCGPIDAGREDRGHFWAVSPNDLALEAAVAAAAGIDHARLPHLRYLGQHTLLPEFGRPSEAELPPLGGYRTPWPVFWLGSKTAAVLRRAILVSEDLRRLQLEARRLVAAAKRGLGLAPRP